MFELIGANGISVDGDYRRRRSRGTPTYVCADGRRILFNSTGMPRFRRWFAQAAGTDTPSAELFLTRSALEWETAINAAGGPTAMVRTASEWLASPHARARGAVCQIEDPDFGPTWMPGVQVHLSDSPGTIRPRHARTPTRRPSSRNSTHGLMRQRRVRLSHRRRTVGWDPRSWISRRSSPPCSGRILVEYGADVIKINQAHPESLAPAPVAEPATHRPRQSAARASRIAANAALLLDLHAPDSRDVLDALLSRTGRRDAELALRTSPEIWHGV